MLKSKGQESLQGRGVSDDYLPRFQGDWVEHLSCSEITKVRMHIYGLANGLIMVFNSKGKSVLRAFWQQGCYTILLNRPENEQLFNMVDCEQFLAACGYGIRHHR